VDSKTEVSDPGVKIFATGADVRNIALNLAENCSAFVNEYTRQLGVLFQGLGESRVSGAHMNACFGYLANTISALHARRPDLDARALNRHMAYVSVCPYYWIEPTGLLNETMRTTAACQNGYGPVCHRDSPADEPMFEGIRDVVDQGNVYLCSFAWRSARTNALVRHMGMNLRGGTANITPYMYDSNKMHNVGGDGELNDRRNAHATLDQYMWVRGQSCIPSPGETIYVGSGMKSTILRMEYDHNERLNVLNHVPNKDELMNGKVHTTVSAVMSIEGGHTNTEERGERRARTQCSRAMQRNRVLNKAMYDTSTWLPVPCNGDPDLSWDPVVVNKVDVAASIPVTVAEPVITHVQHGAPMVVEKRDQPQRYRVPHNRPQAPVLPVAAAMNDGGDDGPDGGDEMGVGPAAPEAH
jgi:hypothetical protein